jgi:hypothetical protein
MTISEALAQRVPRIRKPVWTNAHAYLRLPLLDDGQYGPWAELYDDVTQAEVLDVRPGSQRLFVLPMLEEDGYEVYAGPVSPFEAHNFARVYHET